MDRAPDGPIEDPAPQPDLDADWADPAAPAELPPLAPGQLRRFDLALGATGVILTLATIATLLPGSHLVVQNGRLDLVLNTLIAVTAAGAAALAWIRYRIDGESSALFESSAFLILFTTRGILVGFSVFGLSAQIGLGLGALEQWPIYGWTIARVTMAALLIVAASATLDHRRLAPRWMYVVQVGPSMFVLATIVALAALRPDLPALIDPGGFNAIRGAGGPVPVMNPPAIAIQVIGALLYLRGAQLYRVIYQIEARRYAGFLSVGLLVAGFAQLNWAIFPGITQGVVTFDDLLRAAFAIIILLGIGGQSREDVRHLRLANARLRGLRKVDVERVTLEASARLAREVHDGLTQELWLAKLAQARLAEMPDLPEDAKIVATTVGDAVDRALAGARAVLATMRAGSEGPTLGESLERVVDDFGERSGIKIEYTSEGADPALPARSGAELIRIVQEALTNVRKHADATVVRVNAVWGRSTFEVSVADNGRGFDPSSVDASTFGIVGMRERAELIGAEVEIASRPDDGTTVVLRMPGRAAS